MTVQTRNQEQTNNDSVNAGSLAEILRALTDLTTKVDQLTTFQSQTANTLTELQSFQTFATARINRLSGDEGTSAQGGIGGNQFQDRATSVELHGVDNPGGRGGAVHVQNPVHHNAYGRLTKLEFPRFNGDDVKGWIFRVKQFFSIDNVREDQKLRLVSMHLFDKALYWHLQFIKNILSMHHGPCMREK